jgi:hypothetical protein
MFSYFSSRMLNEGECKELGLSEAISKRWIHGLVRAYSLGTRGQIGVLQIGTRNGLSDS